MMTLELFGHELRRDGIAALALVPAAATIAIAVALYVDPGEAQAAVRMAVAILALASGLAAASVIGRERMLEVQVCLPTSYEATMARRLFGVLVSLVLSVVALVLVLASTDMWDAVPGGLSGSWLTLLGPAMLPAGVAWFVGLRARSSSAASGAAVAAWLGALLVWNPFVSQWLPNVGVQLVVGAVSAILGLRQARDTERLMAGALV